MSEEKPKKKKPPNYSAKKWVPQANTADRFSINDFKSFRGRSSAGHKSHDVTEHRLAASLDIKLNVEKLIPILERLDCGKIDVRGLFDAVSNEAALSLLKIALDGDNEKNKLDATKHLLALAGHNPAQKHEISRLDPNTPKEALLAMISGSKKDLEKAGIELVDDRDDAEDESGQS